MRPASVADDVGPAGDVIENPIDEPGAVQPVRPHGSGAGASCGPDLLGCPPTGVPAQDKALSTPKIIHFPEKLIRRQDHLPPLLAEIVGQTGQNFPHLFNGQRQVLAASNQGLEQLLVFRLQQLLQAGCRSRRSGGHRG